MTEPNTGFRYKAFISYSWKDKDAAGELHRALEAFRTPKALVGRQTQNGAAPARLAPIFRDRDEEAAGASLKAAIEEGLDNSEFLIIVCSPDAAASPWVNKEIAYFRKKRTPSNILTYVIGGEPGPHCFAPALRFESTVDGVIGDEPIEQPLAADAREEGDGKRLARLKIAAAMLGVGLDDLVRRDAQRRARRLRYALAGVSAVALGFAGIAATAIFQWRQAVENEQRATREAMKASRTAEFMVSLFEVVDPGEARGREVTAKEILDKGVKTIETGLADEPDVQASLMHTMGRVYTGLGLNTEAIRLLETSREIQTRLKANDADTYATENALAFALNARGDEDKSDLEVAEHYYLKLVEEAEAAIANGGWRIDFATALAGMGELSLYTETPAKAQTYFERARDLLVAHGLSDSEEMAEVLRGLAGARIDQNDSKGAEELLTRARRIYGVKADFTNYKLTAVENDLAYVYYMEGRLTEALQSAKSVYDRTAQLLGDSHPETLISANNLARYEFEAGQLNEAKRLMDSIVADFEKTARDKHFDFAFPLNSAAEIDVELGHSKRAIPEFERALSLASGSSNRLVGPIKFNLGRAMCETGDPTAGLRLVIEGRAALGDYYDLNDWRYGAADEFESRCLAAMLESKKAGALARSGYNKLHARLGDEHFFTRRAKKWLESLDG